MRTLIIGMGEVGSALFDILSTVYPVESFDLKKQGPPVSKDCDILHICIPWSDKFIDTVTEWIEIVHPTYTVVHSSVPVGTCEKIEGTVVHSPVRGVHPTMRQGLLTYVKYIGFDIDEMTKMDEIVDYFEDAGIKIRLVNGTRTTELMKLLELCRYGTYIAFAKEQEAICEHFGLAYEIVVSEYERSRNAGLAALDHRDLSQPILYPFDGFVGGHCTVEDMELLLGQVDKPLLREAYTIDKGTVIWPGSNIYPTAKIGKGCSIGRFCEIGHNVVIGNNVRIGAFTFIPEGVEIQEGCFIAPRVSFSNDKHPPSKKSEWGSILVKKYAMIGMGSIILPGVTVGENAVIGAGSVVTKDVPDNEVWYGAAAHAHGKKDEIYG